MVLTLRFVMCYTPKKDKKSMSASVGTTPEYSNKFNERTTYDEDDTDELMNNLVIENGIEGEEVSCVIIKV